MKKVTLLFIASSFMLSGIAAAELAAPPTFPAAAAAPAPAAAPAETSIPEECVKLVAAIKACEKIGGFSAMSCKYTAKSKYTCPIPLEKLM